MTNENNLVPDDNHNPGVGTEPVGDSPSGYITPPTKHPTFRPQVGGRFRRADRETILRGIEALQSATDVASSNLDIIEQKSTRTEHYSTAITIIFQIAVAIIALSVKNSDPRSTLAIGVISVIAVLGTLRALFLSREATRRLAEVAVMREKVRKEQARLLELKAMALESPLSAALYAVLEDTGQALLGLEEEEEQETQENQERRP